MYFLCSTQSLGCLLQNVSCVFFRVCQLQNVFSVFQSLGCLLQNVSCVFFRGCQLQNVFSVFQSLDCQLQNVSCVFQRGCLLQIVYCLFQRGCCCRMYLVYSREFSLNYLVEQNNSLVAIYINIHGCLRGKNYTSYFYKGWEYQDRNPGGGVGRKIVWKKGEMEGKEEKKGEEKGERVWV